MERPYDPQMVGVAALSAEPCNEKDCTHSGICVVNGKVYCGTHAWDLRYGVTT